MLPVRRLRLIINNPLLCLYYTFVTVSLLVILVNKENCSNKMVKLESPKIARKDRQWSLTSVQSASMPSSLPGYIASPEVNFPSGEDTCNESRQLRQPDWRSSSGLIRPSVSQLRNGSFYEMLPGEADPANFSEDYFRTNSVPDQPLIREYKIVPGFNCLDVFLLVVQPSIMKARWERRVVRNTWGSVATGKPWPNRRINANVKIIFVIARPNENVGSNDTSDFMVNYEQLQQESEKNQDILFLEMMDNYRNLTLKIISAFQWVKENCPCVQFVLKVDTDTFVNVPLLVDTLLFYRRGFDLAVLGRVYKSTVVFRSGRWAVPKNVYAFETYIPYAAGSGYVLAYKAMCRILEQAPTLPMIPVEDAYLTGIVRRATGVRLFHFPRLFTSLYDGKWSKCWMLEDRKMLGSKRIGVSHLREIWAFFGMNRCL